MKEYKLKPCPFCGSEAEVVSDHDQHGLYYSLGCSFADCIAHRAFYTETETPVEEAVNTWNNRPQEDAVDKKLDANQKALQDLIDAEGMAFNGCCDECDEEMSEILGQAIVKAELLLKG